MKPIEFYTTPEGEITIREQGMPERNLKESDIDFIQRFLEVLEEFYPEAYNELRETYARYDGNKTWRDFWLFAGLSNVILVCMTTRSILMRTGIFILNLWVAHSGANVKASMSFAIQSLTVNCQTGNLK